MEQDLNRIKSILENEKINKTTLSRHTGIKRSRFYEYVKGERNLKEKDYIKIKTYFSDFKIALDKLIKMFERNNLSELDIKKFYEILQYKYFFVKLVFGDELGSKLNAYKIGKLKSFPVEYKEDILRSLLILKLEIR